MYAESSGDVQVQLCNKGGGFEQLLPSCFGQFLHLSHKTTDPLATVLCNCWHLQELFKVKKFDGSTTKQENNALGKEPWI